MKSKILSKPLLAIFAVSLAVRLLTALPMRQPGAVMDAHYYYVGALNLLDSDLPVPSVPWATAAAVAPSSCGPPSLWRCCG